MVFYFVTVLTHISSGQESAHRRLIMAADGLQSPTSDFFWASQTLYSYVVRNTKMNQK